MSERLRQATLQLVEAIAAEDLAAAARALEARAEAIAEGAVPTEEVFSLGERAASLLEGLKRSAEFDASRLKQVQQSLATTAHSPYIDLRG